MINKVTLIGNIGQDAEEMTTQNGSKYTKFSVATNERYTDSSGSWQTSTEWHTVKVWGAAAENALKRCTKGKKVYVEGKLNSFKTKDDTKLWEIRCHIFRVLDKEEIDRSNDFQSQSQPQSNQAFSPSRAYGEQGPRVDVSYGLGTPTASWGNTIK